MLGLLVTLVFIEFINEMDNRRDDRIIRKLENKIKKMDEYLKANLVSLQNTHENQHEILVEVASELRAIRQDLVELGADEEIMRS